MFFKIINRRYIRTRVIQFVYSDLILDNNIDKNILDFRKSVSDSLDLLYCSIDFIKEVKNHFLSIQTKKKSFEIILSNPYIDFLSNIIEPALQCLPVHKEDLFQASLLFLIKVF